MDATMDECDFLQRSIKTILFLCHVHRVPSTSVDMACHFDNTDIDLGLPYLQDPLNCCQPMPADSTHTLHALHTLHTLQPQTTPRLSSEQYAQSHPQAVFHI
jgi:hypothetical protein